MFSEGKNWITPDAKLAGLLHRLDRLEALTETGDGESDAAMASRMEDATVLIDVIGWDLKELLDEYGIDPDDQKRRLIQLQMKTITDNAAPGPGGDALRGRLRIIWGQTGGLKFNLKQIQAT